MRIISALEIHVHRCIAAAPADARPWRIRYFNVWRRQDGQWLNASNQFARIAEPPAGR